MNLNLQKKLLGVEAESFDGSRPEDVLNDATGERVFGRFCRDALGVYRASFPDISAGWVSVAGLEPGFLKPIASLPEGLHLRVPALERKDATELAREGFEVLRPAEHNYLRSVAPNAKHAILVRLIGYDEYYGLLVLCSGTEGYFQGKILCEIKESLQLLNRLMGEAVFSKRLKTVAAPFDFPAGPVSKERMYAQIVSQACLGLAADGSVLRIRRPSDENSSGYVLEAKGHHGLLSGTTHLATGSVFERICRRVFESVDFVTVQTLRSDGSRIGFGAEINEEDDAELRRFGVQAYMIMKLQSDLSSDEQPAAIGTLSVFHRLPQVFSRRDISLFRGYCERVADDLALLDQRDDNEAISKLLQAQNSLGTRAEITALLGHDFGHRVYHVKASLEDFIETCRRNWRDRVLPEHVQAEAKALRKSCEELAEIVRQIRLLGQGVDEPPTTFQVSEVFAYVRQTLSTVLERNNMALDFKVEGNCRIHGVRSILLQVLFNMVINSVDAQKASGRKKLNTIHFTCREVGSGAHRKLEFNVWDEGPGISRSAFQNAQRIFDVGTTSKPAGQGTGTGLPVARSLLGRYFHADLQLSDRSKALFQFSIQV